MTFTHAIARRPLANAGHGLTSASLGAPDPDRMLAQHRDYVRILESLGLQVTVLDGEENYPDGCFVEDLNRTNGVFIDSRQIKKCRLKDGDVVSIGTHELVYTNLRRSTGEVGIGGLENGEASSVGK